MSHIMRISVLAALLIGCPEPEVRPVDGCAAVADAADSCAGWACSSARDCPPTLCARADFYGICADGFCRW